MFLEKLKCSHCEKNRQNENIAIHTNSKILMA